MARLQDFSDVTPSSSSDKLLIVQSAGQGLATLDTAGQQIANNTSVSQLNTTRKTLAGAINEHDSEIGSLSTLTTTDKSSIVGAVNEVNAKESYKVRVSQLTLPSTITLTANVATMVLNNSDIKSLTYSALDDISNISGTLVGVMFMWCSGGGAICLDNLVWEGKCTMYLMSTYTKDITAIRLLTIWKQ